MLQLGVLAGFILGVWRADAGSIKDSNSNFPRGQKNQVFPIYYPLTKPHDFFHHGTPRNEVRHPKSHKKSCMLEAPEPDPLARNLWVQGTLNYQTLLFCRFLL